MPTYYVRLDVDTLSDTLSECHTNKLLGAGVQTSYVHSRIIYNTVTYQTGSHTPICRVLPLGPYKKCNEDEIASNRHYVIVIEMYNVAGS